MLGINAWLIMHSRHTHSFADIVGKHFVTDDDIKEFTSTKMDKQFLSVMTILRHCGRVRQSRSGKITKHILIPT